tara:strand:+ start:1249 stop:2001 length:753 start_codon:yes stop_codon:yes gene_type:complete
MIKYDFKNKNIVLTGGGKGIGKAALEKLYKSGANISLITRSRSDSNLIKRKYSSKRVFSYCGDVTEEKDVSEFFRLVKKKMKTIDGLINNAGIRQRRKFNEISNYELDYVIDNNLKSIFKISQLFSKIMNRKSGSIVNISSIVGPRGFQDLSGYAMTKGGIIGLSKSLAVELAKRKIRVNTISPGFIKSSYANSFKKKLPRIYKYTLKRTPMGRWGKCEEVANLILFILSEESSYITGNNIYIDGGWTSN